MSTIKVSTIKNLTETYSASTDSITQSCKCWVNFNGQGTLAIRQGFNCSSITDNGTGDYTLNFTTALVDSNYAPVSCASNEGFPYLNGLDITSQGTTSLRVRVHDYNSTQDRSIISCAIFR